MRGEIAGGLQEPAALQKSVTQDNWDINIVMVHYLVLVLISCVNISSCVDLGSKNYLTLLNCCHTL